MVELSSHMILQKNAENINMSTYAANTILYLPKYVLCNFAISIWYVYAKCTHVAKCQNIEIAYRHYYLQHESFIIYYNSYSINMYYLPNVFLRNIIEILFILQMVIINNTNS